MKVAMEIRIKGETINLYSDPLALTTGPDGTLYEGYDSKICDRDQLSQEQIDEIADRMIEQWIQWKGEERGQVKTDHPLPSRIRVTGCSGEWYWYRDLIGKEFAVVGKEGGDYIVNVPGEGSTFYVSFRDCEVIS